MREEMVASAKVKSESQCMRSYDWCIVQKLSKVKRRLISDNIFVQKATHENYLPFSRDNNISFHFKLVAEKLRWTENMLTNICGSIPRFKKDQSMVKLTGSRSADTGRQS